MAVIRGEGGDDDRVEGVRRGASYYYIYRHELVGESLRSDTTVVYHSSGFIVAPAFAVASFWWIKSSGVRVRNEPCRRLVI